MKNLKYSLASFVVGLAALLLAPPFAAPAAIPAPPDVAAPPADASRTGSGLASKVLVKGAGTKHPTAHDVVKVHYTGWTTDGKMFDSSVARGQPARFPLNRVIAGWTEGVQLMVEGEKRRFWIPEKLAYKGRQGAPQGMLVFDVELIEIIRPASK
ncbi:MAG: FKBP-type peptidyl-prolyl cis-trans isomerase [Acidobacteriota bacterium]